MRRLPSPFFEEIVKLIAEAQERIAMAIRIICSELIRSELT